MVQITFIFKAFSSWISTAIPAQGQSLLLELTLDRQKTNKSRKNIFLACLMCTCKAFSSWISTATPAQGQSLLLELTLDR